MSVINDLFTLRGKLSKRVELICFIVGTVIFLGTWALITETGMISRGILPSPLKMITSIPELYYHDGLMKNALFSIQLNIFGLLEAIAAAIPIGMIIGLFPVMRSVFDRYISAARFLPLSALVGLFIAWFGIDAMMKVQFLAFAIFIYLLPAVISRVDEVKEIYVSTVKTLGANSWQTIRSVFIPSTLSSVFDDIRNLSALSWTYIIIAEVINTGNGGVGALAYLAARQSRMDKMFAVLLIIMLIGVLQDRLLVLFGKILFPHKFALEQSRKVK